MLETLLGIDRAIFLFLNVTLANPVTDSLMPIITNDWLLRISYALTVIILLIKGDTRVRFAVIASILTLVASDQLSSSLLKPMIGRARPCHTGELESLNLLVRCGGGMSMPSSHAANAFGQAILFGLTFRKLLWPLLAFASVIALSRTFVGVHYPADIMAGALVGAICGLALYLIYREAEKRIIRRGISD